MAGYQAEDVYCTLVMSDSYLPGAKVLSHSLRDAGTKKKLAVLITLDTLSPETIDELKLLYDHLIPVEPIRNPHPANLYHMNRGDLVYAFTKIALWAQLRFRKIVYMDADVVALRAPDELFDIDAPFAAAPDVGWPDAFNTGVMVLTPHMGDYWVLHNMAMSGDSFDGADQGLLNQYYEHKNWHRISFTYNCTPSAQYQWEPAYRHYKSNISATHFIGKDKPWMTGRRPGAGGGGVYNELLGRWWAVHDRHLPPPVSDPSPAPRQEISLTQEQPAPEGAPSTGQETQQPAPAFTVSHFDPPADKASLTEPDIPQGADAPLTDPGEATENPDQGKLEPTPTAEQRRFSAPQMEWDATRGAPPPNTKPEAMNFPTEVYDFTDSRELFHAPKEYPEPPKDMWYDVPKEKPKRKEKPKPIFPWEQRDDAPKPTRVFAEDAHSPEPSPAPEAAPSLISGIFPGTERSVEEGPSAPGGSVAPQFTDDPLQAFAPGANAWDSDPSIENYIRRLMVQQQRKARPQVIDLSNIGTGGDILSPQAGGKERRESLILTDFPSAIERPSLPVTPAPIRRPTFWGTERDEKGDLPAAEGVPDQVDWNPEEKLEELRQSSLVEIEHLMALQKGIGDAKDLPLRELPRHSIRIPPNEMMAKAEQNVPAQEKVESLEGANTLDAPEPASSAREVTGDDAGQNNLAAVERAPESTESVPAKDVPLFKEPDFGTDGASDEPDRKRGGTVSSETALEDSTLSPTER